MTRVVGDTLTILIPIRDSAGLPITDAVDGDFDLTCYRISPGGTLTSVTPSAVSHVANGLYKATISSAVEAEYVAIVDAPGLDAQPVFWQEQVVTAAQADILSATVSGYAGTTVGGRIALITVGAVE